MTACSTTESRPTLKLHPALLYYQQSELYQFDLQSQKMQQVGLPGKASFAPVVSHHGQYLAYADKHNLQVIQLPDGESVLTVPHLETSPWTNVTDTQYVPILWSPDDKWILLQMRRYEQEGIGLLSLMDGEITEFTDRDGHKLACGQSGAAWSRDSSTIIFTQENLDFWKECSPTTGVNQAMTIHPQSSTVFTLAFTVDDPSVKTPVSTIGGAGDPARQPNSDWVVFSQEVNWKYTGRTGLVKEPIVRLFLIRSNGSKPHPLISNATGQIYSPVWDETGKHLFFASHKTGETADGIYISKSDGTEASLIVPGVEVAPIAVSPDGNYLAYGKRCMERCSITASPGWEPDFWVIDLRNKETVYFNSATFISWQMKTD
jgi:Tol biopolymer transport system component